MNKFRRFLGTILVEICLKMNYFGSKSPKIAKHWGSTPIPSFRLNDQRMCTGKFLLLLKLSYWLMQMIGNLEQNETYIFCPSPVQKMFPSHC